MELTTSMKEDKVLHDLIEAGAEVVVSELAEIASTYSTEEGVSFILRNDRWEKADEEFIGNLEEALSKATERYLINYAIAEFLSSIFPAAKENVLPMYGGTYIQHCQIILKNIKSLAFLKRPDPNCGTTYGEMLDADSEEWEDGKIIALLTIKRNGEPITAYNGTADKTADIFVPRKVSELENDKGYISGITDEMIVKALGYTPLDELMFNKGAVIELLGIKEWALAEKKPEYTYKEILGLADALALKYDKVDFANDFEREFAKQNLFDKVEKVGSGDIVTDLSADISKRTIYYHTSDLASRVKSIVKGMGDLGTKVSWGTVSGNSIPLTVAGETHNMQLAGDYLTKAKADTLYVPLDWFYKISLSSTEERYTNTIDGYECYGYWSEEGDFYWICLDSSGNIEIAFDDGGEEVEIDSLDGMFEAYETVKRYAIGTKYDFFSQRGIAAYGPYSGGSGGGGGGGTGGVRNFSELDDVVFAEQSREDGYVWGTWQERDGTWNVGWVESGNGREYTGSQYIDVNNTIGVISLKGLGSAAFRNEDYFALKDHKHSVSDITDFKDNMTLWGHSVKLGETWDGTLQFRGGEYIDTAANVHLPSGNHTWIVYQGATERLLDVSSNKDVRIYGDLYINGIKIENDGSGNLKINANTYSTGGISAYGYGHGGQASGVTSFVELSEVVNAGSRPNGNYAWGYKYINGTPVWGWISASEGKTYTNGNGINLDGNEFSLNDNYVKTIKVNNAVHADSADSATKASRLSGTETYKAWGQTYWQNGVPAGSFSGNITMDNNAAVYIKDKSNQDRMLLQLNANNVFALGYGARTLYNTQIYGKVIKLLTNSQDTVAINDDGIVDVQRNYLNVPEGKGYTIGGKYAIYNWVNGDRKELLFGHSFGDSNIPVNYCGGTIGFQINDGTSRKGVASINTSGNWGFGTAPDGNNRLNVNGSVRIGDAILAYDATNKALKVFRRNGTTEIECNLYATGGISAYNALGTGMSGIQDLQIANSLKIGNVTLSGHSGTYGGGNRNFLYNDGTLMLGYGTDKESSMYGYNLAVQNTRAGYINADQLRAAKVNIGTSGDADAITKIRIDASSTTTSYKDLYITIGGTEYRLVAYTF